MTITSRPRTARDRPAALRTPRRDVAGAAGDRRPLPGADRPQTVLPAQGRGRLAGRAGVDPAAGRHQHRLGPDPRLVEVQLRRHQCRPARRHPGPPCRCSGSAATASSSLGEFPFGARDRRLRQLRPGDARHPADPGDRAGDGDPVDHHRCRHRRGRRVLPRPDRLGHHAVHRPDDHAAVDPDHRGARLRVRGGRRAAAGPGAGVPVLDGDDPVGPGGVPHAARAGIRRRGESGRGVGRAGSSSSTSCRTRSASSWCKRP